MKKYMLLCLSLALCASLAACGDDTATESAQPESTSAVNDTALSQENSTPPDAQDLPSEPVPEEETGAQLIATDLSFSDYKQWSEDCFAVLDAGTGLWGYVDNTGTYILEPQFYDAYPFSEGLAAVQDLSGYYGFIDKTGAFVIEPAYTKIYTAYSNRPAGFVDGYAVVWDDAMDEIVLIDTSGAVIRVIDGEVTGYVPNFAYVSENLCLYREQNKLYDTQFNLLYLVEGYDSSQGGGRTISFNLTSQYIAAVKNDEIFLADANGIFFSESMLNPSLDNVSMGFTDDYIFTYRTVNNVTTSALYDYDLNVLIDYGTYTYLYPVTTDMFIAEDNADHQSLITMDGTVIAQLDSNLNYSSDYENRAAITERIHGLAYEKEDGLHYFYSLEDNTETQVETVTVNSYERNIERYAYYYDSAKLYYVENTGYAYNELFDLICEASVDKADNIPFTSLLTAGLVVSVESGAYTLNLVE